MKTMARMQFSIEHRRSILLTSLAVTAVGAVLVLAAPAADAQQVGTAAAVNPAAQARGSGGSRTIVIGQSIAHRERVQTTSAGSVQLLFLDKSSMTIGPNSDLAIDEYVYDPNTNTGKMAATLSKGVMRFVGGQISHAGNAQISTPNAVIGVRGAVAIVSTKSVYIGFGEGAVTSGSTTVNLTGGDYTTTAGAGVPPTPPGPPPAGFVQSQLSMFQSASGQGGGAPASQGQVDNARQVASGSPTGTIAPNTASVTTAAQQGAASGTPTQQAQAAALTQSLQTVTQQTSSTELAIQIVEQQQPQPPRNFAASPFAFTMTGCCQAGNPTSPAPFLPATFTPSGNSVVSPFFGYRAASTGTPSAAPFFQFGLNITGAGAQQSSWMEVAVGSVRPDGTVSGGFSASRLGGANPQNFITAFGGGPFASVPGTVIRNSDLFISAALINNAYYVPESGNYTSARTFYFLGNGTPTQDYSFTQNLAATAVPSGLGNFRPAAYLTGFTGGLIQTRDTTTFQNVGNTFRTFGLAAVVLDPSSGRLQANFNVSTLVAPPTDAFAFGSYQFGSLDSSQRGRSAYIDYDHFAALDGRIVTNTTTGDQVSLSMVNGQSLSFNNSQLLNVNRATAQQLAANLSPTLSFCDCAMTRWGFWSVESGRTATNGNTLEDRGHLMTWVAGVLPNAIEMPSFGSATYRGHIVGNVNNNNFQYIAAGNFVNVINFATRVGVVTVSGFDGGLYQGQVALNPADTRQFGGVLASQSRQMLLTGNFYRGVSAQGVANPAGEMGGAFSIQGAPVEAGGYNYTASGIFAASTTNVTIPVTFQPSAFAMSMTACCNVANQGSVVPYLPASFAQTGNVYVSPVLGYRVGSQDAAAAARTYQYGFNVTGVGAAQNSWLMVATGAYLDDGSGDISSSAGFVATRRGAANVSMGRASGTISSTGAVSIDQNRLPLGNNVNNDYLVTESGTLVSNPAFFYPGGGGTSQNYTFTQQTSRIPTPAGLGAYRPEVTLTAYTGGLMRTSNVDAGSFVAPSFSIAGGGVLSLNPNNSRLQANFTVGAFDGASGQNFSSAAFQFGSQNTSERSEGSYIDYDNFGARRAVTVTNTSTGAVAPKSTVNNQPLNNQQGGMIVVPRDVAQAQLAQPLGGAVNFCDCAYTRWGFWSNESNRTVNGQNYSDRGHMMTWVAGQLPTIAEVPLSGSATYAGHVVASIKNGANEYLSGSNFTNQVNFGTRVGAMNVSSLDGASYSGNVQAGTSDPRHFSGVLGSSVAGRQMAVGGSFFRGTAGPVGEIGGRVNINNSPTAPTYIGGGIFAGRMQ